MAATPLIPRLNLADPLFIPTTPDFAGAAQAGLGDLGTGADGFDAIMNVPISAIDADAAALSDFDALLAQADFTEGDFASVYHAPVDAVLPAFLSDGDALNNAVQNPGSTTGDVVIQPPPNPPAGGGGGGDGGGGGGGGGGGDFTCLEDLATGDVVCLIS
jgi:hypothetical protein